MEDFLEVDLCVIGAGSGGLTAAAGAAQMGARVALVEAQRMGGDCLNTGCVPSKSLIAAAACALCVREGPAFGIEAGRMQLRFERVRGHIEGVIAAIAPHDSVERFEGLGVRVIRAPARFLGPREIEAGGCRIRARRFVIATGSKPSVPPVRGLAETGYLTNETIFDLEELPGHLLVLGAGPIGCELAQAYRRLGSRVSIVDIGPMLPREDPELVAVVRRRFEQEGIELFERAEVRRVEPGPAIVLGREEGERRLSGSHLLVATGRVPRVEGLDLEAAGVEYGPQGVAVDLRMRTSNPRIFAIGDVTGAPQFTHAAAYQAGIVLRQALLRLPARVDHRGIPRVTFTDPAIAQIGFTPAEAESAGVAHEIVRAAFEENDRARTEARAEGLVKLLVGRRRKIVGAGIVGHHVDELLAPLALAMRERLGVTALAGIVLPYPTRGEILKRAAGRYFEPTLFGAGMRRLVRILSRLG